jgi:signal transduction histidine kinase
MYIAVFLRSVISFGESPKFDLIIVLLVAWLLVFIGSTLLTQKIPRASAVLMSLEIIIVLALLLVTYSIDSDLFAFLFAISAMQFMQMYTPKVTAAVIGLASLITFFSLFQLFGILQALALTLVYSALGIFLAAYIWATRQSRAIQEQQQALTNELQIANQKLNNYAQKVQQLATNRERQRLARELHDSVTQTIFSMTLAVQTARMSMRRDQKLVAAQLDRLDQLTRSALSEMQALIFHLAPEDHRRDLLDVLQQHLVERERLDNLVVKLEVEGHQQLNPLEEANLYRIAQEALNNIVKHAGINSAVLRLHLIEPFWMEVEDRGIGFDPQRTHGVGQVGLTGMRERAAEIGWKLELQSASGKGTNIRVLKGA